MKNNTYSILFLLILQTKYKYNIIYPIGYVSLWYHVCWIYWYVNFNLSYKIYIYIYIMHHKLFIFIIFYFLYYLFLKNKKNY